MFEEDEEVKGWRAWISVGYCNDCDMNLGEMVSNEKLCGAEASTINSLNETRKSLTATSSSSEEKRFIIHCLERILCILC